MPHTISRARFVAAAAGTFASIAILPSRVSAEPQFTYKMGHHLNSDHPMNVRSVQLWNDVAKETGGKLKVNVFGNNMLGGDVQMLAQLRSGALEFMLISGAYLNEMVPVAGMENLPFVYGTPARAFAAMDGPLGRYIRDEMSKFSMQVFPRIWDSGFRQITSGTKPIRTLDDLQGFKIRTPESKVYFETFRTLGAAPTPISLGELYTALQTKVVDGQENPYATIETSRYYEVQKYLSVTNHIWAGDWLVANVDAWKRLPPDVQRSVVRNAEKYALLQRRDSTTLDRALSEKIARQGLQIARVDTAPFKARLKPFYARWRSVYGPTAWRLLENAVGPVG